MPLLIAWRNLVHDRMRFTVTLIGIVFSVVLMGMQLGLLLNFVKTTATMVDHGQADIWISAAGVKTVDITTPIEERRKYQTLAVPGVGAAEAISLDFVIWKRPDGVRQSIILVGLDPDATMGRPWDVVDNLDVTKALTQPDGIIIDKVYAQILGVTHLGQVVEIADHRARVVGFTEGIRTFTQSPYVFTSLQNSRRFQNRPADHITYVLVRTAPGHDQAKLLADLRARLPENSVRSAAQFSSASSNYWLFSTGAGVSLIMSGVLGLLVGGVIVAQTLYASTMDRLPEYATLRAIGGSPWYLVRIVLGQALIGGTMGYSLGIAIVATIVNTSRSASAGPELPLWLALAIGLTTLGTCAAASVVSLSRVLRIDPVSVFR